MSGKKAAPRQKAEPIPEEPKICSKCGLAMREPSEWVRSKKKIFCSICYQSLLYPNRKMGSQEIVD
jgi:formylmethanofuran dehydrogenase subunit E